MARRALLDQFQFPNVGYIGCTVTVYVADATGAATATKATLYEDLTGSGVLTNPQTFDSEGKLPQPTYFEGAVVPVVAGAHVVSQTLGVQCPPGSYRGDWAPDTFYLPGDWVTDGPAGDNTQEIFSIINFHESDTWAADSADTDKLRQVSNFAALSIAPDATETAKGKAEIATEAETKGGTDDGRIVTPLKAKALLQAIPYDTGQVSTDAGAAEGPTDEQFRDSATPAAADLLGVRSWAMRSSTAVKRVAAKILGRIVDATNASEDAALDVHTIIAGTLARRFSIGAGLYADGLSDVGAGTVNATGYSLNGMTLKPVIQAVNSQTGAVATGTTQIPADDTIPQITEGTEFLTATITPKNTANTLEITAILQVSPSVAAYITAALFQDSTAGALAVGSVNVDAGAVAQVVVKHRMTAGTTSATTFRVRAGPHTAATVTLNGASSARLMGGVFASSITVTEYGT